MTCDNTKPNAGGNSGQSCDAGVQPCPYEKKYVKGTPVKISPSLNSIICKGGKLVVQSNNSGPDKECTEMHERSHIQDWKQRYGEDLCVGVSDGDLPVGGDGYGEFLRESECKAYKAGRNCRENLIKTAEEKDQNAIKIAIDRDNEQLKANKCG